MRFSKIKPVVIILFILSGICGLIYEVAWAKYLSLFIGNTAYSHMIVLATFMGGLALGAFYWGRYADKSTNQLKLYGILEIVIGVYCLIYPTTIGLCEKLFISIASSSNIASDQTILLLIKFLLSFITLIIPTFIMGGTLPILTKFLTKSIAEAGKGVATLYYINSLGAVIGTALAGFYLIRIYSLDGAIWIASVLNLIVGVTAVLVASRVKIEQLQKTTSIDNKKEVGKIFSQKSIKVAIITAAVSGFTAFLYELAWIRLLSNILGSSTYSFSIMLIAFISGIALGSWIVSLIIKRVRNLMSLLWMCQLGTAISMILMLPLYERLPYYLIKITSYLSNQPENFSIFLFIEFLFCFVIMILPTTFSGMSLPVASRIASNDIRFLGKSIGGVFSINTIGTVIGALVTGLILIPIMGVKLTIEIGVLINGVLGLAILFWDAKLYIRWRIGFAVLFIMMAVGYRVLFPVWNEYIWIIGAFRTVFAEAAPKSFEEFKNANETGRKILWYKEGVNANVAVIEVSTQDTIQRSLVINGKTDASTIGDLSTQVLLAQTPLLLLPNSGDALVIGLGSGITCGSALRHPLRSLDCVEISSEVVEGSSFFANENYDFLFDPRTKLYVDDAITYLKITPKKYNYIISEPSNPWIAGIGNLFSTEFFELCKKRLQPGGVLTQWFHTYDMDDQVLRLILNTITKSFPVVTIWRVSDSDILILASTSPINPDFDMLERKFMIPAIAGELARINIFDLPTFLSTQITTTVNTASLFHNGIINSEKRPLLEFLAPITFFTRSQITLLDSIDERFSAHEKQLMFSQYEALRKLSFDNYLNIARFRISEGVGDYRFVYSTLKKCLQLNPKNVEVLNLIANTLKIMDRTEEYLLTLRTLAEMFPEDVDAVSNYAMELFPRVDETASITNPQDMLEPIRLFQRCVELTKGRDERYILFLGLSLSSAGQFLEAAELFAKVIELREKGILDAETLTADQLSVLASENFLLANQLSQAEYYMNSAIKINPNNEHGRILATKISLKIKGY
ncbi:MAG: fused MFS/spermidine synthase [Bacteroidota bacterium]|nr:fused MFS/spermidine synthase [Bacteroidota bacterium]